ncbi:hypothetical protein [Kitasatospora sp. NPDC085464]|uniref:hypothetical protein n=1 Tax=Kitasatospora sp. NPDC085464 TaxID=3364063 RepID=UPI0037C6498F
MGESTVAKAVQKVTGMWWPDADPDKLRKVAHEVDKAIKKLEEEAAIVGGTLVVGAALAFVTFGISADTAATAASVGVAVSGRKVTTSSEFRRCAVDG